MNIAIILAASIACTNCNGVGSIEVKCDRCDGRGVVFNSRRDYGKNYKMFIACKKCFNGLYDSQKKGSGKVVKKCPSCKGQKKIKEPLTSESKE